MNAAALMLVAIAGATASGCWESSTPVRSGDPVRLGDVAFDVPAGWHRTDMNHPGALVSVWVPDVEKNPRKESITVIRSELVQPLDDGRLEKLVSGAQIAFAGAKTSKVITRTTDAGLVGYQVDVEFTPQSGKDRYRRTHVVLRDHGRLVHVMYTARTPDPERDGLETVLSTLRHEEAAS